LALERLVQLELERLVQVLYLFVYDPQFQSFHLLLDEQYDLHLSLHQELEWSLEQLV
jgi:hypothetical protein